MHRGEALEEAASEVETRQIAAIQPVERRAIASSPDASPAMLELLAGDGFRAVRLLVARHPSTPRAALVELTHDRDAAVAQVASACLQALDTCEPEASLPS